MGWADSNPGHIDPDPSDPVAAAAASYNARFPKKQAPSPSPSPAPSPQVQAQSDSINSMQRRQQQITGAGNPAQNPGNQSNFGDALKNALPKGFR